MTKYWVKYKEKVSSDNEPLRFEEGSCFVTTDDIESWWDDKFGQYGDILTGLVVIPEEHK